jgi:phosphopantetheinyl transferase (holo-ACP synthase)
MNDTKVNITQIANVHTDGDPIVMFAEKIDGVIRATEANLSVSTDRTVVIALMTLPLSGPLMLC